MSAFDNVLSTFKFLISTFFSLKTLRFNDSKTLNKTLCNVKGLYVY